jgi:hypothetical protein
MTERQKETGLIDGDEQQAIEIVDYDPLWPASFRADAK